VFNRCHVIVLAYHDSNNDDDGAAAAAPAGTGTKSESDGEPKPRALHKTQSIFLRNLVPTITHQEVEAVSSCAVHCPLHSDYSVLFF